MLKNKTLRKSQENPSLSEIFRICFFINPKNFITLNVIFRHSYLSRRHVHLLNNIFIFWRPECSRTLIKGKVALFDKNRNCVPRGYCLARSTLLLGHEEHSVKRSQFHAFKRNFTCHKYLEDFHICSFVFKCKQNEWIFIIPTDFYHLKRHF